MQEVLKKSLHPKEEMVTKTLTLRDLFLHCFRMFHQVMHVLIKIFQMRTDLFYIPLHVFDIVVNVASHLLPHALRVLVFLSCLYISEPHSVIKCISKIP